MLVSFKSDVYKSFDSIYVPDLILRDEYGHCLCNVTKVIFRLSSNNLCLVTVNHNVFDKKACKLVENSRSFILKDCKIDLSSIGLTEKQEEYKPCLETACKKKIPWYVRIAMKVVKRYLEKEDRK